MVDRVPERLRQGREIGAVAVDFTVGDPVQQIKEQTGGEGTDKGVDAVGYQAAGQAGDREEPAAVLNQLVQTVRPTGALGVPGLYVPSDPGGVDENARQGMLLVAIGKLFEKGLRLGAGQANVKRYNRAAAGHDHRRPGPAQLRGVPRAAARRGAGRLPEVRPARGWLHEGHPQTPGQRIWR